MVGKLNVLEHLHLSMTEFNNVYFHAESMCCFQRAITKTASIWSPASHCCHAPLNKQRLQLLCILVFQPVMSSYVNLSHAMLQ